MENRSDIKINIPKNVSTILSLLESSGFEAYIVGGCVRDALLNKVPTDYDITTNATPDEVKKIFNKTIDTGIEHGTVTVRIGGESFEVTTYRIDGKYTDRRHPDQVLFTPNLKEDLMRRDFTINAMAYSKGAGLIDYYDGLKDLLTKTIRCVRDPILRFKEDALRMVRAIRFSATLGFEIESQTLDAIKLLNDNLKLISKERIQVELVKLLLSPNPERFRFFDETELVENIIKQYHDYTDAQKEIIYKALKKSSNDYKLRLAILLGFINSDNEFESKSEMNLCLKKSTKMILRDLKFDNKTINDVSQIVAARDMKITCNDVEIRKQINQISKRLYPTYLEFKKLLTESCCDEIKKQEKEALKIIDRGDPTEISELGITGKDLIENGFKEGKDLGRVLSKLLQEVIIDPEKNNFDELLKLAKNKVGRLYEL